MTTTYGCIHPYVQLQMLRNERAHVQNLVAAKEMWNNVLESINLTANALSTRKYDLLTHAWKDEAGAEFGREVDENVQTLRTCVHVIADTNVMAKIDNLAFIFPNVLAAVEGVCIAFKEQVDAGFVPNQSVVTDWCDAAGRYTEEIDRQYDLIEAAFRRMAAEIPEWTGPRAELPGPGTAPGPGDPAAAGAPVGAASTAGGAPGAGTPQPVDVTEPQSPTAPENPAPGQPQQPSDLLGAAANALQAAQGLLGGMQVPDAIPAPDLGDLDLDPAEYAEYGQPTLSGFDPGTAAGYGGGYGGAAAGGVGASPGATAVTGPGGAVGAGTPPVAAGGLAGGAGAVAAAAGRSMPPPMMPPNHGAANAKPAAGIKPGTSDRPAAQARPRPRHAGPVTPGVALAGRAGAAQHKPAAQRSWDSDNDSLQVLDEQLWQVTPQEEETHGQDRRRPGRDSGDRAAARRTADAGLVGPGRHAGQPTRAR